ncbi:unnamed protein product [Clonostachys chloroleuca]|uniref:Metallo-beta-lactamase domain-containing protein n=1 Tax=Clonostachys chloroleuca TaxID=1926264 RepID=A0AA35MAN0_9HYPO|nr:unnamed protein product [Clonostachys chloroleuca]
MEKTITISARTNDVASLDEPPAHWIGNPPTHFQNPWPSFRHHNPTWGDIWRVRFGSGRNFIPVPAKRDELVNIRKPDWGAGKKGTKATWFGHSSFLIETAADEGRDRGVRILMDPVFYERMGPTNFIGPKRFSETPCKVRDLPLVDVVCISHNHYDHLDIDVIKKLYLDKRRTAALHFFCGLGTKAWFTSIGVRPEHVTEMDWWDELEIGVLDVGTVKLVCTPAQHGSRRSAWDRGAMLWCGFILEEVGLAENKRIYFAGDTGYRSITEEDVAAGKDINDLPRCPAFAQIGERYGPFDLSLLPIGCYTPRTFLSGVHCAPEDSIEIHVDIRSKKSLGMHYGTVRGGLSAQYEDVREPPRRWREACEKRGLTWNDEITLCDIGETVFVE